MGESSEELGEEGQTDGAGDPRGGEECKVWRRHRMSLLFGLRGGRCRPTLMQPGYIVSRYCAGVKGET